MGLLIVLRFMARIILFFCDTRIATNNSPVDFHQVVFIFKQFVTCQECETAGCYPASKVKTTPRSSYHLPGGARANHGTRIVI